MIQSLCEELASNSMLRSGFILQMGPCVSYGCLYPVSLRIGPAVHDYTYTYIGAGVYKCARGSGWARHLRLFLVCHDGFWYAVDAPPDSSFEDIMRQGVPIFRSSEAVLEPGWHTWERNMKAHDGSVIWKATGLCAVTMILTSGKYERDC